MFSFDKITACINILLLGEFLKLETVILRAIEKNEQEMKITASVTHMPLKKLKAIHDNAR